MLFQQELKGKVFEHVVNEDETFVTVAVRYCSDRHRIMEDNDIKGELLRNNIGSVFRTADAFLIEKIYLCGITAIPPHKDIQKTALGSTDSVEWEYREDAVLLIDQLVQEGVEVWAVEQAENATFLQDYRPQRNVKTAFVLGNEVKGVQQEVINTAGKVLEIPQEGTKHSLNISVTAGVVCWDFYQKLNAK